MGYQMNNYPNVLPSNFDSNTTQEKESKINGVVYDTNRLSVDQGEQTVTLLPVRRPRTAIVTFKNKNRQPAIISETNSSYMVMAKQSDYSLKGHTIPVA